jgi:hypothetical protein
VQAATLHLPKEKNMALYKHGNFLNKVEDAAFDVLHSPGEKAPLSGIYICTACKKEVASNEGQPLPPQNHSQHSVALNDIKWRLTVYADHRGQ